MDSRPLASYLKNGIIVLKAFIAQVSESLGGLSESKKEVHRGISSSKKEVRLELLFSHGFYNEVKAL